eukprot:97796-Amphidinium_carterae.1
MGSNNLATQRQKSHKSTICLSFTLHLKILNLRLVGASLDLVSGESSCKQYDDSTTHSQFCVGRATSGNTSVTPERV